MAKNGMLDLPPELFSHHVFQRLELNDLLRLRRVCKPLNELVNDHIRLHGRSKTQFSVNFGKPCGEVEDKKLMDIDSALKLEPKLPTTNFSFVFKSFDDLFEGNYLQEFLLLFGTKVEELKMSFMSVPLEEREIAFYESFPNLKRLTIGYMDASNFFEYKQQESNEKVPHPRNFENLTHFTVDKCRVSTSEVSKSYMWTLLHCFKNLEYFSHPEMEWDWSLEDDDEPVEAEIFGHKCIYALGSFAMLRNWLKRQSAERKSGNSQIKSGQIQKPRYFDMKNYRGYALVNVVTAHIFSAVCVECDAFGLKFLNVDGRFTCSEWSDKERVAIGNMIVSLRHLYDELTILPLPVLEKLVIPSTAFSCLDVNDSGTGMAWPSLKTLEVTINSQYLSCGAETRLLLYFLFCTVKRPNLQELKLSYENFQVDPEVVEENDFPPNSCNKADYPTSFCPNIVISCCNITKLTLEGWPGSELSIHVLWLGLEKLEEVTLKECEEVGDVTFTLAPPEAEYNQELFFVRLKNLRKLSLLHLDKMPRITDTAFSFVFRHLKLKEFYLSSSSVTSPLENITKCGIRSLQSGAFADTIEKFPFEKWSLADSTQEEMDDLKKQFRSSFML